MENSQQFCGSVDQSQALMDQNQDSDQMSDSDEKEEEEEDEPLDEERDEQISAEDSDGDSVVDEELEALVEKAFSRNSRLQQLLQMNEMYKTSISPKVKSGSINADHNRLTSSDSGFTAQASDQLERHGKRQDRSPTNSQSISKAFEKLAKDLLKCPECEEWFTTDNKRQIHVSRAHNKSVLNCIKCNFSTRNPKEFSRHTELHLNGRFGCSAGDCTATFHELLDLRDHSAAVHQRINCDKCERSFKLQSSLFEHNKRCHTTDEDCLLQCPICCHKYNCRTRYEKHVKSHDLSNRFHCQQCDQSFDKAVGLEVHVNRDHKNCRPFVCDICQQQFYANEKLLNHLSNKHKMAVYGCESCDYKTNSKYKMARHQLIHSANRYKCDVKGCYQVFETKYNLTIHKKNKHLIESDSMDNSDNNSNNSSAQNLMSNSNSCSNSFDSQTSNKNENTFEDNDNKEFFSVTDFLQIDLKSGDNEEDEVIQLDDSSGPEEDNNQSEVEYESHMNSIDSNGDKNGNNLSENPILSQILQQKCQNLGKNSNNFSIVYNKNKNSLLINQNCGKTNVTTIQKPIQSQTIIAEEEGVVVIEDDDEEEEEESQKFCTFSGCQQLFPDGKVFRDHILAVHKLIKCNKCEKCFQSFSGLYKHKRRYHRSQRQIVCRFCDKKFFYQTSYEKHIETHGRTKEEDQNYRKLTPNGLKTYSCYDCDELFAEKYKYLRHLSKSHSIAAFECDLCDYKSMSKKLLASHMVRHSTAKPYKCDINGCNLNFKSKNSLQIHKRVKHMNQNRFVCEWPDCGKQFSIKTLFDYHMASHTGDKPFTQTAYDLRSHQQRPEKTIKCLIIGCDQLFSFSSELDQHMRDKHDITIEPIPSTDPSTGESTSNSVEARFVCLLPDCGKRLVTKQALEYHMAATHTGVKPYQCQWKGCDYRTVTEPRLKLHMRTHTKPLNCPIAGCPKMFAMNRDIKRHLRNKHKGFDSSSDWYQLEDSLNDSDVMYSFVESNVVSIDDQNYVGYDFADNVKQEPIDEYSEDMATSDQNMDQGLDSMDTSSECNSNFSLITELMRKSYAMKDLDTNSEQNVAFYPSVDQSSGYWDQNNSDSQNFEANYDQNLLCFECNQTFGSYDMLYRHNNEFHNKYKPKYK